MKGHFGSVKFYWGNVKKGYWDKRGRIWSNAALRAAPLIQSDLRPAGVRGRLRPVHLYLSAAENSM